MSRHTSYGKANKGTQKRNVLKRFERIEVLKKLGRWIKKKTNVPPVFLKLLLREHSRF